MAHDPHASHGAAVADPHGHAPGSHGHDAHGSAAQGHGGGHGHDEAPTRTPVPPFEKTPWGMIAVGVLVAAAVLAAGLVRNWGGAVKGNPKSMLGAPGQPAQAK